jgi:prevent-host-death family protein
VVQLNEEIVGVTDARDELPRRVRLLENGELGRVVIVRHSSPVAVILSVEEYDRMVRLDAQREALEDAIAVLEARKNDDGTRIPLDDIKRELDID